MLSRVSIMLVLDQAKKTLGCYIKTNRGKCSKKRRRCLELAERLPLAGRRRRRQKCAHRILGFGKTKIHV